MHHEGTSSGPGRAWGGAFMAFMEASSPGPSRAWRGGFMVVLCAMQYALLEGPGEEPSWHFFCSMRHEGEWAGTLFSRCNLPEDV